MVSSTEVRQIWARQGAVPMTMAPAEFNNYIQADITKWERVIQSAGIKAD
jgi:tripartite-type tricarboxylate transporter receptor subunit TctC